MRILVAMAVVSVLSGCASITGSKLQPISVQTVHDNKEVAGVGCTLTNDAGKWFVTSPGSVTVNKSTGDLAVDCAKDDLMGHDNIASHSNGSVWGNIIAGGGIGYIVDRNTGAGFDYPNVITIILHRIGEVVSPSSTAAKAPDSVQSKPADPASVTH